jgi:FkbM family methyltransferase
VTIFEQATAKSKATLKTILPARLYGPIRAHRVRNEVVRYRSHTVRHSYAGLSLDILLEDGLAEAWYDHDWEEPPEVAVLRNGRLTAGATVFDIGAHQAVVALILGGIVGPDGRVIAVEAEPHNARVAQANVTANGATNVTVINAAGAADEGVISFAEGLNGEVARRRGAPGAVDVPTVTVDGLAKQFGPPDVVLIDVEGYEAHVLDGADRTLAKGATDFLVELHDAAALARGGSSAERVVGHFLDRSMYVRVADDDGASWHDLRLPEVLDGKRRFLHACPVHEAEAERASTPAPGRAASNI